MIPSRFIEADFFWSDQLSQQFEGLGAFPLFPAF